MQSKFLSHLPKTALEVSSADSMHLTYSNPVEQKRKFLFEANFIGQMDMYSDLDTVAKYLNAHEGWFCRCARPMKVEPLPENGYVLTVGKYGSFGYEVEPKIGVILEPPIDNVYVMHTIPLAEYEAAGYEVNYDAVMKLQEEKVDSPQKVNQGFFAPKTIIPQIITRVSWELALKVKVEFPQFITKLSPNLIQSTGDRLLGQIVSQVSPRLTYKVQQDFHTSHNLPLPHKSSRQLHKVAKSQKCAA